LTTSATKIIAIVQSNYIPWKGYFDLINTVDEFVLYDDAQYTRRDWRNRNKIKTSVGLRWLSIPVKVKSRFTQSIFEAEISEPSWAVNHWRTIVHNYSKCPHFDEIKALLEPIYCGQQPDKLSAVNYALMKVICDYLDIKTRLVLSSQYEMQGDKSERLLSICKQAGAHRYLSGPAAQCYLDTDIFNAANISVEWADYSAYPEYPQLHPPFEHGVSIIDLLFNAGRSSSSYMKSFKLKSA
jgi:hypothetical protein